MPARHYAYVEERGGGATVTIVMSEEEILAGYPHWQDEMRREHREDLISPDVFLEDWCALHWATEIE